MLNARLSEAAQRPNASFAQAFGGTGSFVRGLDVFSVSALVRDGGTIDATSALITELRRVDQFGFLQSELDRAKQNLLRGYERAYAERDKTPSTQIINQYVAHYLERRTGAGDRGRVSTGAAADSRDRAARCEHAREHVDHRTRIASSSFKVPTIRTRRCRRATRCSPRSIERRRRR